MIGYGFNHNHNQTTRLKGNNVLLAPISTSTGQYLSNNSIFNLATKRR